MAQLTPEAIVERTIALADRLGLRPAGGNRWRGPCPRCRHRSLQLRAGDRGVLLTCWGGCETAEVLAAAGLGWAALGCRRLTPEEREAAEAAALERAKIAAVRRQERMALAGRLRALDAGLESAARQLAAICFAGAAGNTAAAAALYHAGLAQLRHLEARYARLIGDAPRMAA